jgi:alpha-tubulin suppressor-like RCC1 family protein
VNNYGQLGLGDALDRGDGPGEMGASLPFVDLGPGAQVASVSACDYRTCALLTNGSVKCWGSNSVGQLGLGDAFDRGDGPGEMGASLPFVDLGPGAVVASLGVDSTHSCALFTNGSVKCWGFNDSGQLGLGDALDRGDGPGEMGANLATVAVL